MLSCDSRNGTPEGIVGLAMTEKFSIQSVRTGDTLLFANNTPTGFLLRQATKSHWSHVGIAVRLLFINQQILISLNSEGELFVLEISTSEREDVFTKQKLVGAAVSPFDEVKKQHNIVGVRHLKDEYLTEEFRQNVMTFIEKYRGYRFTSEPMEFIQVWLGIPFLGKTDDIEIFCTELNVKFYSECLNIHEIFGEESPLYSYMYRPEDFNYPYRNSIFLDDTEPEIVFQENSDPINILLMPIVLGILVFLILLFVIYLIDLIHKRFYPDNR